MNGWQHFLNEQIACLLHIHFFNFPACLLTPVSYSKPGNCLKSASTFVLLSITTSQSNFVGICSYNLPACVLTFVLCFLFQFGFFCTLNVLNIAGFLTFCYIWWRILTFFFATSSTERFGLLFNSCSTFLFVFDECIGKLFPLPVFLIVDKLFFITLIHGLFRNFF